MSEALPRPLAEALEQSDRFANVEQQIFMLSPLGTLATAATLFAAFAGSFVLISLLSHVPLVASGSQGLSVPGATRAAFVLSLLIATALGIQRYARLKDRADIGSFPPLLRHGVLSAAQFATLAPRDAKMKRATLVGLLVGVIASIFVAPDAPLTRAAYQPTSLWFAVTTTLLCMLFVRGVEMTRASSAGAKRFIDDDLVIDLLRIDHLAVMGRSAARAALIWFSVSAVTCLFFVGGALSFFAILALLIGCAGMGVWIFVRTMEHVHRKIRAAKGAELERTRAQIAILRDSAYADADAATKLQGLLAYEARIAAVHEWPFDQTTLVRVGASALILTVPWFGQAVAGTLVEHLGQWMR